MENQNVPPISGQNFHQENGQKLPNATGVLILGIASIITCCCWGIIGLICGGIGLYLAKKDETIYQQNPALYSNYQNLNTGKILCYIGITLSALNFIYTIYILATGGMAIYQEQMDQIMQMQNQ